MSIEVRDKPEDERYEVFLDGQPAGYTAYRRGDAEITLTHTEVDSRFKGRGVGSGLARGVLDDIRGSQLALLPSCEFIKGYIARHDEYVDLVPAARRSDFGL
jgi:predicted GNAT family acetyltransferase